MSAAALGEGEHQPDRAEPTDRAAQRRHVSVGEPRGVTLQAELVEHVDPEVVEPADLPCGRGDTTGEAVAGRDEGRPQLIDVVVENGYPRHLRRGERGLVAG